MDGGIQFNGLVGVVILMASIILLSIITLISLGAYLYSRRYPATHATQAAVAISLLVPAICFLIFDCLILLFLRGRVMSQAYAIAFDNRVLWIWTPVHIIGYLVFATFLYLCSRKPKLT